MKLLSNKDNPLLMCFVADLLFLIKVFQKKLQSDSLTIVDIEPEAEKFRERVNKLSTGSLLGVWGNEFKERYDEEANKFCGIKLWEKERRRPDANLFVTDRRKFSAIRNESVIAINTLVDKRLQVDRNASKSFIPFVKIMAKEDEIKEVYRSIAPDLDLANVQSFSIRICKIVPKCKRPIPSACCKTCYKEQRTSIQMSLSSLAAFLHANPIQLVVSGPFLFITRSNQHADHLSSAKPSAITFTYI